MSKTECNKIIEDPCVLEKSFSMVDHVKAMTVGSEGETAIAPSLSPKKSDKTEEHAAEQNDSLNKFEKLYWRSIRTSNEY